MKINRILPNEIHINKFSQDFLEQYEIDENCEWLAKLLNELEEDNDDDYERTPAKMTIKASITKKSDKFLNDHVIFRSSINGHYHLPCGRCLAPVKQDIDLKIDAAFLNESMEKMPEYLDMTTVFADGQEMELYFYRKGIVNIEDLFHEQLYTELAPFPRCVGECVGEIYF